MRQDRWFCSHRQVVRNCMCTLLTLTSQSMIKYAGYFLMSSSILRGSDEPNFNSLSRWKSCHMMWDFLKVRDLHFYHWIGADNLSQQLSYRPHDDHRSKSLKSSVSLEARQHETGDVFVKSLGVFPRPVTIFNQHWYLHHLNMKMEYSRLIVLLYSFGMDASPHAWHDSMFA